MKRRPSNYKDTQIFDWQAEPHDERPSEFAQSTGYSALSGYHVLPDSTSRRRSSSGFGRALVAGGLVIAMCAAAMVGFVHFLHT